MGQCPGHWGISVPKYIKCSSLTGRPLPVQVWVGEGPEKEGGHFLPNSTTSYTSRLSLNGHSPRFRFTCFQGHQMKIEAAFCPHTTSFSFQPQRGHSPRIDILVHRIDFKFMREKKTLLPHASTSDGRRCDPFSHTCCLASVASRVWFNSRFLRINLLVVFMHIKYSFLFYSNEGMRRWGEFDFGLKMSFFSQSLWNFLPIGPWDREGQGKNQL